MTTVRVPLSAIAHGRSGDKGNHANVAVIAYTDAGFAWLREHLTAGVVAGYFAPLGPSAAISTAYPSLRRRAETAWAIGCSSSMTTTVRTSPSRALGATEVTQ